MQNVLNGIKKFLMNKNTVTILGVLAAIAVLYIGYNWRVKQAIDPQKVPYAKVEIASRTLITADMVGYTTVSKDMLKNNPNIIRNSGLVVGKYVSYGTTIPENSLFYSQSLMTEEEMPDSAFANIPDNYTIYSLNVNLHTTYGNSIYPGNYIDLYVKLVNDNGEIVFGKLIESIEVLAVKDSSGNHVFETTVESRTPSELLFAVPNEMYRLLMQAGYIGYSLEIIPVPRNASYSANPGETRESSEYIKNFILSKTVILPEDTNTNTQKTN